MVFLRGKMVPIFLGFWTFVFGILISVDAKTNAPDVAALNVMYSSLNSPEQLTGWKSGGDPCGQSWKGITCSGSSVTEINLSGLGLTGSMGYQLSSLTSVTYFDLSKNNLKGDIPYQLPPNAVHLNLAGNGFTGSVPYSISLMADLKELNLGHNQMKGQLSDMFGKLSKLTLLDLSFNSLSGNLPQSFGLLSSLTTLYLQNNQFTGPITVLARLSLDDLNIANNQFSGWIPNELKDIDNIETGGNSWSSGSAPPPPPGTPAIPKRHKHSSEGDNKSVLRGVAMGGIVMSILVALVIVIALFSRKSSSSSNYLDDEKLTRQRPFSPLVSHELSDTRHYAPDPKSFKATELSSMDSSSSIDVKTLQTFPSIHLPPPSDWMKSDGNEFANKLGRKRTSVHTAVFTLADLQPATGNFAAGHLLGEGTIGRVYRAKYADGKVLAVKKIDTEHLQSVDPEEFSGIVSNISKLQHPNIAQLVGYCSEQGHNLLVYEYFRNGSLHAFLHLSDAYSKPLTWNTRIMIALGTARAVEYLHEICSPSCIHKNIKSANILLDAELNPCLTDCGLANFHQHTSQNLGVGYNAPECIKPSAYTLKSDVYSFGVVMLELLTGRVPYDSSKPRMEQSLVRWATPQLHDIDALDKMVDPALHGLYPPKSLSRFADVIALCVQSEPEFRPPMSEVVQALVRLVQRSSMVKRGDDGSGSRRMDDDYF
ncbi:hypothetical protein NE237_022133 [Protea cynaroides]|uniref:Protein kinase domain-containing protein n=1 Tax=Protea cynaroides TaxID=273540 RepID=A0A9Q0K383_9MAGN|nr:hypothetical protein NE237_022133 [Protea cynaroides]